ncbi:MAG: DNA recombination protein RmuC [Myxococcales bacterium]|nr:DNA recombination protein RmuC [Myxococcales bacterium]USN50273.1 MAG: DNA recombination protein RmuC [Myxococcales bacterium]
MNAQQILIFATGFFLGALSFLLIAWNYYVRRQNRTAQIIENEQNQKNQLTIKLAQTEAEYRQSKEYFEKRINDLNLVHDRMKETFSALAKESLIQNMDAMNTTLKQSVDQLLQASDQERQHSKEQLKNVVAPLKESLSFMDKKVSDLEAIRQGAYSGLKEQIEGLLKSQAILQQETGALSKALQAPSIRGRWGEMQLRRVVELSGLSQFCDFIEQCSIKVEGEILRPDMVVTLPQNKKIVIDAKVPLEVFGTEDKNDACADLVTTLKRHLMTLKKKSYAKILGDSPEFTVMFLPTESLLHRALVTDPSLLDYAAQNDIIIATPVTLIALLKGVAFSFKQESIANNIEEVRKLAQQLIDRVGVVSAHFGKLGKSLKTASESYNQTLSSLDSRVFVTARKLSEIKSLGSDKSVESIHQEFIDVVPREIDMKPLNGSES